MRLIAPHEELQHLSHGILVPLCQSLCACGISILSAKFGRFCEWLFSSPGPNGDNDAATVAASNCKIELGDSLAGMLFGWWIFPQKSLAVS